MSVWSLATQPSRYQAGIAFDTHALDIHDVTVPVPHLPRHLEGFTIAHLTDTHLRRLGPLEERSWPRCRRGAGGGRADRGHGQLSQGIADSGRLLPRATAPGRHVLAIRGNHEVSAQVPVTDLRRLYRQAGARLLVNEHVALDAASPSSGPRIQSLSTTICALPCGGYRLRLSGFICPMRPRSLIGPAGPPCPLRFASRGVRRGTDALPLSALRTSRERVRGLWPAGIRTVRWVRRM